MSRGLPGGLVMVSSIIVLQCLPIGQFLQPVPQQPLAPNRDLVAVEADHPDTRIYGKYRDGETAEVRLNGETETRVVSRIFENREFGFLKVTVERPLRMNFEATAERIARLDDQTAFANLATSKKRKNDSAAAREIEEGRALQDAIRAALATLEGKGRYMDREAFEADLTEAARRAGVKIAAPIKKAIFAALGERDPGPRSAATVRAGRSRTASCGIPKTSRCPRARQCRCPCSSGRISPMTTCWRIRESGFDTDSCPDRIRDSRLRLGRGEAQVALKCPF